MLASSGRVTGTADQRARRLPRKVIDIMRLAGTAVSDDDCKTLVDLLFRAGRANDLELASRIEHGVDNMTVVLALTPAERAMLLGVLDDAPESLAELRGALARELRESS